MDSKIFVNGSIYVTGVGSRSAAVGVVDGVIAAIGTRSEVGDRIGQAEEIDLAGGLLSPGFVDAHLHPIMGGAERAQCDLNQAATREEVLRIVAEFAAVLPEDAWVTGGGWQQDLFPNGLPTRQDLDAATGGRPAILRSGERHSAWANTAAFRAAGIGAASLDPSDGRIEREADGFPSGTLHEGAIMLVQSVAPEPDLAAMHRGLLVAQQHCFSHGITGWQDAILRVHDNGVDALDVYLHALERGELQAKVRGALWWDRNRGLDQVGELIERRNRAREWAPRFRADSIKVMLDGTCANFTALLTQPYHDGHGHATENHGMRLVPFEQLESAAKELDAAGFQMHFHALGDQAVRDALDAISSLPRPSLQRHHLAHLQIVQPDDANRFSMLGAIANLQPLWAQSDAYMDDLTIPFLDPQLRGLQYPFGTLERAGARIAAGSDWPVSDISPVAGMHVAVNRNATGSPNPGPFLPEQALELRSIWDAYTAGSAYVNGLEDKVGRISVGYDADFAIFDTDPFTAPPEQIGETRVVSTWVDGREVYSQHARV